MQGAMRRKCAAHEQVSGRRFLFRRLSVAVSRCPVRHNQGPSESNLATLPAVAAVLMVGLCFVLVIFNPAGQIGSSRVLAQVASGGLYDTVEGYR